MNADKMFADLGYTNKHTHGSSVFYYNDDEVYSFEINFSDEDITIRDANTITFDEFRALAKLLEEHIHDTSTLYQIRGNELVKYDDIPKIEIQFETEELLKEFEEYAKSGELSKAYKKYQEEHNRGMD